MEISQVVVTINGVEYVKSGSECATAEKVDGMRYCIVRTTSAGVFAGYIKSREDQCVEMVNARRLWFWSGAASLSQLATDGTSKPKECKFPCAVSSIILTQAIEILTATAKAKKSIEGVPVWEVK